MAIYWTRRNHQYGLRLEDVYLELNAFPNRESNPGPFDLELTVLTVVPPCFGFKTYLFFDKFEWFWFDDKNLVGGRQ